jgi:hypothetical protein
MAGLLDRPLRGLDALVDLVDFRHQGGVGFQQHLRLLGDACVDRLHLFLARGRPLDVGQLLLQLGHLVLRALQIGGRGAGRRGEGRGSQHEGLDDLHVYLTSTRWARRFCDHAPSS